MDELPPLLAALFARALRRPGFTPQALATLHRHYSQRDAPELPLVVAEQQRRRLPSTSQPLNSSCPSATTALPSTTPA
jgi:hypothetical protein